MRGDARAATMSSWGMRRTFLLSLLLASFSQAGEAPSSASAVRPLMIGAAMPDPAVRRLDGEPARLRAILGGKPAVVVFYRGGWCPYCNAHLRELKDAQAGLDELGYRTVAISPDRPEELAKTLGKHALPYTLLSDSKMEAARSFGLAFRVDDETVKKYLGYGIDLEKSSGEKHHWLPVPGLFLADAKGVITFVYANPDYKTRLRAPALLAAAKAALEPPLAPSR